MTSELPAGVVSFLFTDIEGSTAAWDADPETMRAALELHDTIVLGAVSDHSGVPVKARGEGDSWFVVFASASDAVEAAGTAQGALAGAEWPTTEPISVRMAIHTGSADLRDGDYYGPTVNRAARLRGIAHGGQTVISGSTYELVQDRLPDTMALKDLGEHALRDLERPERVYQLDVDGLSTSFAPLRSVSEIANNLPAQLTEFIGREDELAFAETSLESTRLLTVLAAGGTGKSRLAIEVATNMALQFQDGVFFIALADIATGSDILQATAEAIGLSLSSDDDPKQQILRYLAAKRQLLIFDNFEHVRSEAGLVTEILTAAPNITVIATSRTRLGLTGETVMNLSGLSTTWSSPEEARSVEAVQLFVKSAQKVDASFELTDEALPSLGRVLGVTGGSPLAILLAAAWVDMLPMSEIADEIEKSLDFLETETGDGPDRHRSVRAVFDYTWETLNDSERSAFTALSVFKGGFNRAAADAVASASLRTLSTLSNKSLLTSDRNTGRYALHELLRQYAEAELASDPERCAAVLDAHAAYFTEVLSEALPLVSSADQPKLLEIISVDIENVRTAWRRHLENGDALQAQPFGVALHYVYELRGWYRAGVEHYQEVVDAFNSATDDDAVAAREIARGVQAWFRVLLGQVEIGAEQADGALNALPDDVDPVSRMVALQASAIGSAYLGRSAEMREMLERYQPAYADLDVRLWTAGMNNWVSFARILDGDFEAAEQGLDAALSVYEELDEHYYMTWALWLKALMADYEGRPADAIVLLERQVERCTEVDYRRGLVTGFGGLGVAQQAVGDPGAALASFVEAMRITEQMGMRTDMLGLLVRIAETQTMLGNQSVAAGYLRVVMDDPDSVTGNPFILNMSIAAAAEEASAAIDISDTEADFFASFDDAINDVLGRSG